MSDEEVICAWMEPKPKRSLGWLRKNCKPLPEWWDTSICVGGGWEPRPIFLDMLWEVEERLTDEQWREYRYLLCPVILDDVERCKRYLHATAEQKIAALATVLRPIVEGKCAE